MVNAFDLKLLLSIFNPIKIERQEDWSHFQQPGALRIPDFSKAIFRSSSANSKVC